LDLTAHARRLRDRAEELRLVADIMMMADSRATFLRLAVDYDGMADQAERLARRLTRSLSA
jgi:hypothetical protein